MKNSKQLSELDVYFLKLRNGNLVLSSLESIRKPEELSSISIHASSNMLDEESRMETERELLHQAEKSVSICMQDRHYIPRLLISAAVFLVVYLFLSLVIRDPVPMLDELLIGIGSAVLVWVLLSKHDRQTALSSKLMLDISALIHSASVCQSEEVDAVEEYLSSLDGRFTIIELADILAHTSDIDYPRFEYTLSDRFIQRFTYYIEKKDKTLGAYHRMVIKNKGRDEKLSARLVQSATAEGLDLEMLLFLSQISLN